MMTRTTVSLFMPTTHTMHAIQWGDAEVLDKEQNWSKRNSRKHYILERRKTL